MFFAINSNTIINTDKISFITYDPVTAFGEGCLTIVFEQRDVVLTLREDEAVQAWKVLNDWFMKP